MITKKLNGKEVNLLTISELAKLGSKSTTTLKKWEEKGWLPEANWRNKKIELPGGGFIKGERLYTEKYARLIAAEIKTVQKGIKIPHDTVVKIASLFKQERTEYGKPQ
jgi:hypothetical protein